MRRTVQVNDGRHLDLNYFVEWRPWLWRRPLADTLEFLGDLRGKRVLEIGGGAGRVTSLFALCGARVTMVDKSDLGQARAEIEKWGVGDRVRLVKTQGGLDEIGNESFDAIFTKSVLWSVEGLSGMLDQLESRLAPSGKVAFLENYRGGKAMFWLRRNVIHRGKFGWEYHYYGMRPDQLPLFSERFADVHWRRNLFFVYEIFGRKR